MCWSVSKVVLYITSVAGVLTSSDFFPSLCTLEVGQNVPDIHDLAFLKFALFSHKKYFHIFRCLKIIKKSSKKKKALFDHTVQN